MPSNNFPPNQIPRTYKNPTLDLSSNPPAQKNMGNYAASSLPTQRNVLPFQPRSPFGPAWPACNRNGVPIPRQPQI